MTSVNTILLSATFKWNVRQGRKWRGHFPAGEVVVINELISRDSMLIYSGLTFIVTQYFIQ